MAARLPMKGFRTVVRVMSGATFQIAAPDRDVIHLRDIAHHLAQCNRYNGACLWPYSVARHCIHVASVLPMELRLAGLLHDAPEAYLGDVVRPLKVLMDDYREIEAQYQEVIESIFGLERGLLSSSEVKYADCRAMASEMASDLLGWEDILEYPLAPIDIVETGWREDRLAYVLASCLLALPAGAQAECLASWQDDAVPLLLPRGISAVASELDSRDSVDIVDRALENALGCRLEERTAGEVRKELVTAVQDLAEIFGTDRNCLPEESDESPRMQ